MHSSRFTFFFECDLVRFRFDYITIYRLLVSHAQKTKKIVKTTMRNTHALDRGMVLPEGLRFQRG